MTVRIYCVRDNATQTVRLIEAATPAQARSFVAKLAYSVSVPSAGEVAGLFQRGTVKGVERADGKAGE